MLDALVERQAAWTVGAITAFIALMNHPNCAKERFASLRGIVSGGAPIPPSVVEEFERRTGHYIHSGYGLTETTGGRHRRAVWPAFAGRSRTAARSPSARPLPNIDAWVANENGEPLPIRARSAKSSSAAPPCRRAIGASPRRREAP